jgi:[histone H3]-lysine9 N-trimethyltransferase EHMT
MKCFLIIYDDGDKEDLYEEETRFIIERATAVSNAGLLLGGAVKKSTASKKAGTTKAPAKRKAMSPKGGNNAVQSKTRKVNNNIAGGTNNNNNAKRSVKKSPSRRSNYISSYLEEEEEVEEDQLVNDSDNSDDEDGIVISQEYEEQDSSDNEGSLSSEDEENESDLLLPYNPRSPASYGGSTPRTSSPGTRENVDRNASGSVGGGTGRGKTKTAAAAAAKLQRGQTPLRKKTALKTKKKVTPTKKNSNPKAKLASAEVLALLPPQVQQKTRYVHPVGQEPWRKVATALAVPVYETPDVSPAAVKIIHDCKQQYYRHYRQAELNEAARVEAAGFYVDGKRLARRPDRVTESWMKNQWKAVHQSKRIGYVAGVRVNQRFYARAELSCVGMHLLPVAGIEYISSFVTGLGIPIAASIVCAGWYEDDNDAGDEIIFTGEGGNDLLGSRKQVADQKFERGNEALVGNIRLGLPVRVTRKNKDTHGIYGCVLIFDGLYDVVEYWMEPGKEGFLVYRFRLVRRPGQGELLSQAVKFGGISAPKKLTPLALPGIIDLDIANGQENVPIPAVNETDDNEVPPCTALARIPEESVLKGVHRGITNQALSALTRQKWKPTVEYVTEYKYTAGVVPPSAPVLPRQFSQNPHGYIAELNHGRLPYLESRNGKLIQLREALPVVYECGPWTGCPLGKNCPQAVTQQGINYRLEIFKTSDGRGWGVRSLDMIPQFAFICDYYGEIYKADAFNRLCQEEGYNGDYSMDMAVRPDRDWEGNTTEDRRTADNTEYVVCGLKKRNVAAFLNHSCAPNCFAQPVLDVHHNTKMPKISVFASEDIAPFTQLTWDYGEDYASFKFDDGCKCGAADCIAVRSTVGEAPGATPSGSGGRKKSASPGSSKKKKQQQRT